MCDYDTTHLEKHKREINSLYPGVDIHPRKVDAGNEADVEGVVNEALEKYGRLDIFFANAGISGSHTRVLEANAEDFMKVMRTNALGVMLAAKHGSRAMLQTSDEKPYPSGSIIGTASVAGLRSNAGATDYSASKAAVISIMQTSSYQLAGTGIRCNAICPGIIETGMTSKVYEMARAKGTERKIGQLNPLMRGGVADEVARVALFLGSDEASYVNGQAWAVCGGLSAGALVMRTTPPSSLRQWLTIIRFCLQAILLCLESLPKTAAGCCKTFQRCATRDTEGSSIYSFTADRTSCHRSFGFSRTNVNRCS